MKKFKSFGLTLGITSALFLAACGDDAGNSENTKEDSASISE
ncbi:MULTISPECIES: hypothetical protein [Solibacillus]|nr:hypothetical protein [Solibacillus faecavium]